MEKTHPTETVNFSAKIHFMAVRKECGGIRILRRRRGVDRLKNRKKECDKRRIRSMQSANVVVKEQLQPPNIPPSCFFEMNKTRLENANHAVAF